MNNELKLMGAVFALNALMLAVLLTVMLGLAPTPQSVFAGAASAGQPGLRVAAGLDLMAGHRASRAPAVARSSA